MNVLLSCAGRRHYLATYFNQALGKSGRVIGTDMDLSAPALQACDVARQVPGVFAPNYLTELKKIIVEEKVDMVFSLNDLEAGLLAESRSEIENETGATVYVPPLQTLQVCADKWRTSEYLREIGVAVPSTFLTIDNVIQSLELGYVHFPLIIKPRWGSASIGLFIVETLEDLKSGYEACQTAVEKSALSSLGSQDSVIIQEFIKGAEYGVDVLYGKDENFIGFTAKKKIAMRAGETDKAVTVDPKLFSEIITRVAGVLPHRGNLDCDFLERDGVFYLLEFNPRFGGGYPFTHMAGANHVEMLLKDYRGLPLGSYHYTIGKSFAKFDCLVDVS